mgnify:CR=1 FL=1
MHRVEPIDAVKIVISRRSVYRPLQHILLPHRTTYAIFVSIYSRTHDSPRYPQSHILRLFYTMWLHFESIEAEVIHGVVEFKGSGEFEGCPFCLGPLSVCPQGALICYLDWGEEVTCL